MPATVTGEVLAGSGAEEGEGEGVMRRVLAYPAVQPVGELVLGKERVERSESLVASTSCRHFSYSASSRIRSRMVGTSVGKEKRGRSLVG